MQASNYIKNISFGGIPNSRNVLFHFYKSFRNVLRNQALETLWTCWNLTWPCTKDSPKTFSGTRWTLTWLCTKASQELLRNLLRNPVEPDLALHQSLPEPSLEPSPEPCWTWPGASQTFSGTFSGTLLNQLNLTWLCTRFPEPCWTWPVSAPNPKPSREPSEPSPETRWTWPGACTSAHRSYSGLKTPSASAVGEKLWTFALIHVG